MKNINRPIHKLDKNGEHGKKPDKEYDRLKESDPNKFKIEVKNTLEEIYKFLEAYKSNPKIDGDLKKKCGGLLVQIAGIKEIIESPLEFTYGVLFTLMSILLAIFSILHSKNIDYNRVIEYTYIIGLLSLATFSISINMLFSGIKIKKLIGTVSPSDRIKIIKLEKSLRGLKKYFDNVIE